MYYKKIIQSKGNEEYRSYQSRLNNAQGHLTEGEIAKACLWYKTHGQADIEKTPEPFCVLKKEGQGIFKGRFTRKKAQPDFKGTLMGGRSIVFEVKSTQSDCIGQSVLTETQKAILENYDRLGAIAFVCVAIQNSCFTIPWTVWRDMKDIYGRKYIKSEDVQEYKVRYSMGIMFLDKIHLLNKNKVRVG